MTHDVKVNFAIAGAQKSGTRALGHFLAAHPEIGLMREVEAHYFDRTIFDDESGDYSGYHALYEPAALAARMTGDITPLYIYLRDVPERMRAYNPDFRIIVILRNPIERAYSQWIMQREKGLEHAGFLRTILTEPLRYLRHGQDVLFSHVARGFYARQLDRLFAHFPREQVLVLRNDELSDDHAGTLGRVYRFLGVAEIPPPAQERVHARSYAPMPRPARWLLRAIYASDIARLERMMGWDLGAWR